MSHEVTYPVGAALIYAELMTMAATYGSSALGAWQVMCITRRQMQIKKQRIAGWVCPIY